MFINPTNDHFEPVIHPDIHFIKFNPGLWSCNITFVVLVMSALK